MNVSSPLSKRTVRVAWLSLPRPTPFSPEVRMGWKRWLTLALLGGYLLFCHGCHGNEDDELFGALDLHRLSAVTFQGRGTSIGTGWASICTDCSSSVRAVAPCRN